MDSSKIKKNITSIIFSGKYTIIGFGAAFNLSGDASSPVNEENNLTSDLLRHPDFIRAMERFKVHAGVRLEMAKPEDKLGQIIDAPYFKDYLYENDPKFSEFEVLGVIITTKKETTGFQINVKYKCVDEEEYKVKTPVISTIKSDGGYNYPLITLAKDHLDNLILEAEEFLKGKNGNPQLRMAV